MDKKMMKNVRGAVLLPLLGICICCVSCNSSSSIMIYDIKSMTLVSTLSIDTGNAWDDAVVGLSAVNNVLLTAKRIKHWNKRGRRRYLQMHTRLRLKSVDGSKIKDATIDFPIDEEQSSFSPKGSKVIVAKLPHVGSLCIAEGSTLPPSSKNANSTECCQHSDRLSLYCVEIGSAVTNKARHLIDLPYPGLKHALTWVDEDQVILTYCADTAVEFQKGFTLSRGYFLIDTRSGEIGRITSFDNVKPYNQKCIATRECRYANLHQDHGLGLWGMPVACSAAKRLVIPDMARGMQVYELSTYKKLFCAKDVKLPFAAFDANGQIVAWGCGRWIVLSATGQMIARGEFPELTILGYLGDRLFFCEKNAERTDRAKWALFGRECKKYVVDEHGTIVKTLDYARWAYGRLGGRYFVFRWQ